jgi:hypothetical protein
LPRLTGGGFPGQASSRLLAWVPARDQRPGRDRAAGTDPAAGRGRGGDQGPALPDVSAVQLTEIIAAHMRYRQGADAQVLLTRLRKAIAPHVPPPVLDDVVLFLNETRYRS